MSSYMSYADKLRDPRWQRLRLQVMECAEWKCEHCGNASATLNVHHKFYVKGYDPWDYEPKHLQCLCERCHEREHDNWEMLKADGSGDGMSAQLLGYLHGTLLRNGEFSAVKREGNVAFTVGYIAGLGHAYGMDWRKSAGRSLLAQRLGTAQRLTHEWMMELKHEFELVAA